VRTLAIEWKAGIWELGHVARGGRGTNVGKAVSYLPTGEELEGKVKLGEEYGRGVAI